MTDISNYALQPNEWLRRQLCLVAEQLTVAYAELGSSQAAERQGRVRSYLASQETSVAGKERDAEAQTMHLTIALYEVNARIKALTEERDLLRLLLDAAE